MKEPGHGARHTTDKKAELEELKGMNTDQESRIMAMKGYHERLLSLNEQAWDDYKGKRLEHREM